MNYVWHYVQKLIVLLIWLAIILALIYAARYEMRTSRVQAELFSRYAANMNYDMGEGRNDNLVYPGAGPYDLRMGYTRMPDMLDRLEENGYSVLRQPRLSQSLEEFINLGGYVIYNEKTSAGVTIYDRAGGVLHSAAYPTRVFTDFNDIPPLVTETLLFVENRELLDAAHPYRNPAIEWDRFAMAAIGQLLKKINPHLNLGGGSTLATQIEKFRHSPEGRTDGAKEKLTQMFTASVRAYRHGQNTMTERRRVLLDYLNSTPLTARGGLGEVNGLGDGLYAWFGTDLAEVKHVLSVPAVDQKGYLRQATLYKQVLALLLAQRRPSFYLLADRGALNALCNKYLRFLTDSGIIDPAMYRIAAAAPLDFKEIDPVSAAPSWITMKASNAVRLNLMKLLGVQSLYELDRIDVSARSTLDSTAQKATIDLLQTLATKEGAEAAGLIGFRLFKPENDFSKVIYSAVLYERTPYGNAVRVQADNLDKPLDLNEGGKMDLGSTAKLRTMASYLQYIAEIYDRYKTADRGALNAVEAAATDNLTRFVVGALKAQPDLSLKDLLDQAMEHRYSGNPSEVFFTGGGIHSFVNFEHWEDGRNATVEEAFANSINLSFIRIMADVRDYLIAQGPITKKELFGDPDHPARQAYLARFADREGRVFLSRFYDDYHKLDEEAATQKLFTRAHKTLTAETVIYRALHPQDDQATFNKFIARRQQAGIQPDRRLTETDLQLLYANYGMDKYDLTDRGYIAGVNPLELWIVDYLLKHRGATRDQVMQASVEQRQETYSWLFQTRFRGAQDTRIRILIEQDAFARLHQQWSKFGYPFDRLVPSLATSIGSSADRPGALADLMGIIVNDGVRLPTVRIEELEFAKDTPYETAVKLNTQLKGKQVGEQVMRPEVAARLRVALADVVQSGTAKRVAGVYKDQNGEPIAVGGKTGTGDHRYNVFAPGGRLVSSRAVERTGTFVFYIGRRFYGTITAHVAGEEADDYKFTSALAAQLLKALAPAIEGLVAQQPADHEDAAPKPSNDTLKAPAETGEDAVPEDTEVEPATGTAPAAITPDGPDMPASPAQTPPLSPEIQ